MKRKDAKTRRLKVADKNDQARIPTSTMTGIDLTVKPRQTIKYLPLSRSVSSVPQRRKIFVFSGHRTG
jgi:hypothetical protein